MENPLQSGKYNFGIFFFQKSPRKSMDDMGIGEIVGQVLFGPNVLERSPTWQVSSLKKNYLIFLCVLCYRNWEVQPLTKSLYYFLHFFSMKKNEKSQNLFVTG